MKLSIRFKLSLGYALIMLLATGLFLAMSSFVARASLHKTPEQMYAQVSDAQQKVFAERWSGGGAPPGPAAADMIIDEILRQEAERQLMYQLLIYLVLMGVSFGIAYIVAGYLLNPLHEALRLQTQFIENASHELKTPLTIVQTNLESSVHDAAMTPQLVTDYVQPALNSTALMNKLIEDLLLLSVTKQQIQLTDVDVVELTKQSVNSLMLVAQTAGRNLKVELPLQSITVKANNALLQRAIMNVIENAIKYGKQEIRVTVVAEDKGARISVEDDGIGIPAEALSKLGERFYRVDSSRSKATGGTGLGVAITKAIIELHSGSLHFSSEEGKGTTVAIVV